MDILKLKAKPRELEAVRFSGSAAQAGEIIKWIEGNGGKARYLFERIELEVSRDEAALVAKGEWIIRTEDGTFTRRKHGQVTEHFQVVYP